MITDVSRRGSCLVVFGQWRGTPASPASRPFEKREEARRVPSNRLKSTGSDFYFLLCTVPEPDLKWKSVAPRARYRKIIQKEENDWKKEGKAQAGNGIANVLCTFALFHEIANDSVRLIKMSVYNVTILRISFSNWIRSRMLQFASFSFNLQAANVLIFN